MCKTKCDPASQNHQKVARNDFLVKDKFWKRIFVALKMMYNSIQMDINNPLK